MRPYPALLSALLPFALAAPALAQGVVWVVDDDGGAGVDFSDIQPAVDAASDGDLVLVRNGDYTAFVIDGKSLTVTAGLHDLVVLGVGGCAVRNLGPGQQVTLRGLNTVVPSIEVNLIDGLVLENNQGPVWIENCLWQGGICFPFFCSLGGSAGVRATDCDSVMFAGTTLRGGETFDGAITAGHAVIAVNSNLSFYDCIVVGGLGFPQPISANPVQGANGGHAIVLDNSFFLASGTNFEGARGGDGAPPGPLGEPCSDGGDGGSGVSTVGNASSYALLQSSLLAGAGGLPGGPACSPGTSGGAVDPLGGVPVETVFPLAPHTLSISSPVPASQALIASLQGQAGNTLILLIALVQDHVLALPFTGVLLVPATSLVLPLGVIPPTGFILFNLSSPGLPPGLDFLNLYLQMAWIAPDMTAGLGSGTQLSVLQPGF